MYIYVRKRPNFCAVVQKGYNLTENQRVKSALLFVQSRAAAQTSCAHCAHYSARFKDAFLCALNNCKTTR